MDTPSTPLLSVKAIDYQALDLATVEELENRLGMSLEDATGELGAIGDAHKALQEWTADPVGPRPTVPPSGRIARAFAFLAGRQQIGPAFTWDDAGQVHLADLTAAAVDAAGGDEDDDEVPTTGDGA